jgi:hypothetical protein
MLAVYRLKQVHDFLWMTVRIGPFSYIACPLAHTNTKISPISTINYSTKIGDLLELQNVLADLYL